MHSRRGALCERGPVVRHGGAESTDDGRGGVDVGARVGDGVVQRRPALLVGHVQLGAGRQQHLDDRHEALAGRQV